MREIARCDFDSDRVRRLRDITQSAHGELLRACSDQKSDLANRFGRCWNAKATALSIPAARFFLIALEL